VRRWNHVALHVLKLAFVPINRVLLLPTGAIVQP
jgi:hypothetical protein